MPAVGSSLAVLRVFLGGDTTELSLSLDPASDSLWMKGPCPEHHLGWALGCWESLCSCSWVPSPAGNNLGALQLPMALPWSCHLCLFHTWWLWGRAVFT